MENNKALLLIDLQNDFCEDGSLPVKNGSQTIHYANTIIPNYSLIFASKDSHPKNHMSFASYHDRPVGDVVVLDNGVNQILWPDHCVVGTNGEEFHPDLKTDCIDFVIKKGENQKIDSYSAFFDNARLKETVLNKLLQEREVKMLDIMGLATDYCVYFTALDALDLGYQVNILLKGCRGVCLQPNDVENSLKNLEGKGGRIIR